jgi:chromosome segregation ATPase
LPEGRKTEGNPTVPAANTVPDTKPGDQMTEIPKPESETLEKSPSTQTEPSDKHKDAPNLPSHQDDGDGISGMGTITDERWTEIKDGVGLQDADPDKKKVTNGHQDEHLSGRPSFQSEKEATKYYRNKYRDFKSENKLLTASEAELAAAKAELAAKNKELHADNSKLHHTNKQIRNENTRLQQALDEEKNRIKQLQNKNAQLQRTLEEERNQNKQLQTKHTQFRTESAQLQRALDDERKRSSTTTKKADQLQERLDDLYRSHIHSVNSVNTGLDSISDQNFEEKLDSIHDEVCSWITHLLRALTMHS